MKALIAGLSRHSDEDTMLYLIRALQYMYLYYTVSVIIKRVEPDHCIIYVLTLDKECFWFFISITRQKHMILNNVIALIMKSYKIPYNYIVEHCDLIRMLFTKDFCKFFLYMLPWVCYISKYVNSNAQVVTVDCLKN